LTPLSTLSPHHRASNDSNRFTPCTPPHLQTPRFSPIIFIPQVILKIIKHSREFAPAFAYGKNFGHQQDDVLHITKVFPFPTDPNDTAADQLADMTGTFFDAQPCGLYSSCTFDESNDSLLEICNYMSLHQHFSSSSVLILYNPALTQRGIFSFRVVRLTDNFLNLEQKGVFTAEAFHRAGLKSCTDIFQDIPFLVHNNHLIMGYLFDLQNHANGDLLASHQQLLDPSPTAVSNQLLEKLLERVSSSSTSSSTAYPPLFDQYIAALERYQRESALITRQKGDYIRKVEEIRVENQRRSKQGLSQLPQPHDVQMEPPSVMDLYLLASRINSASTDLCTLTQLAQFKQNILKSLLKPESQVTIE